MFKKFAFLAIFLAIAPNLAHAVCSRANLTRCLDSVCAINVSTNPAARCQYCGTTNAGEPPTKNGIKSVSVGASTRFNISDKELKSAPNDPGQRYVWATTKCIERVTDCTPDDVSDELRKCHHFQSVGDIWIDAPGEKVNETHVVETGLVDLSRESVAQFD